MRIASVVLIVLVLLGPPSSEAGEREVTVIAACTGPGDVLGFVTVDLQFKQPIHEKEPVEEQTLLTPNENTVLTPQVPLVCWGKDVLEPPCKVDVDDSCKGRTASKTFTVADDAELISWTVAATVTSSTTKESCSSAGTSLPAHTSCQKEKYGVQITIH